MAAPVAVRMLIAMRALLMIAMAVLLILIAFPEQQLFVFVVCCAFIVLV
jgi:hypothetical protein